jgi:putative ABC transport system permease protein
VLRTGATLHGDDGESFDVLLEAIDLDGDVWAPTVDGGTSPIDAGGIVLARKAADDLGVSPGVVVTLEHPVRRGDGFAVVQTRIRVAGVHPDPFRRTAYVDRSLLEEFGVAGLANSLHVLPAPGHDVDDVERELFGLDGVASVQPAAAASQVVEDSLEDFAAVFRVLQAFLVVLALLIASNAASINADERARERATLFAFGLSPRRVIALETAEGAIIGALATAAGVAVGQLVLRWVIATSVSTTMPDIGMAVVVSGGTLLVAAVLGIVAVAAGPLFTVRRLHRMNIPATLRVVE